MKITFNQIKALEPCWSDYELRKYLPTDDPVELTEEKLLSISRSDCCWLLAQLLTKTNRVIWAKASADRAKKYANAAAGFASVAKANTDFAAGSAVNVTYYAESAAESAAAADDAAEAAAATRYANCAADDAAEAAAATRYANCAADYAYAAAEHAGTVVDPADCADVTTEHLLAINHALQLLQ